MTQQQLVKLLKRVLLGWHRRGGIELFRLDICRLARLHISYRLTGPASTLTLPLQLLPLQVFLVGLDLFATNDLELADSFLCHHTAEQL